MPRAAVQGEAREAAQRRAIAELGARVFRPPASAVAALARYDQKPRLLADDPLFNAGRHPPWADELLPPNPPER